MMPDQDLPPTPAADVPQAQPTIVSTKLTLHDLFTGGWKRPLTGLSATLDRPLARWTAAGRNRAAAWRLRTPRGTAHRETAAGQKPRRQYLSRPETDTRTAA